MERLAEGKRLRRSPSLPPLLPHTPPQQRSRGRHRFSVEEKLAFGSRTYVKCNLSEIEARSVASSPGFFASKSAASSEATPEPSWMSHPDEARSEELQQVIERILPTEYGSFGGPATLRQCRSTGFLAKRRRKSEEPSSSHSDSASSRGVTGVSKSVSAFPKDALERFRVRALRVHRSLHDAFAPLEKRCYFEAVVGMHEVRTALSRIDVEAADELFVALTTWPAVSLSAFFDALVSSSPEASIWEFGAGLIRHGIWPIASKRSLEDMRKYMKSPEGSLLSEADSKCQNVNGSGVLGKVPSDKQEEATHDSLMQEDHRTDARVASKQVQVLEASIKQFLPLHLDLASWNRFCIYLGLKVFEAKRLGMLLGDSTGIDLQTVFEAVRVTVSPGTSLPRLALKAIDRYNSLRVAFNTHCSDPGSVMRWLQFVNMVRTLDVPDRLAMKLWLVLVSREVVNDSNLEQMMAQAKANGSIHLEVFVKRLAFWVAGNEMLESLKGQLRESFGNLQEARRAFRRHGLPSEVTVSPSRLGEAFQDVGVTKCDPDVVILATSNLAGNRVPFEFDDKPFCRIVDCVTLDDIVDVMRSQAGSQPGKRASNKAQPQSQTQALQRQLHDVFGGRSTFRRGRHSSCPPAFRSERVSSEYQGVSAVQHGAITNSQGEIAPNSQVEIPERSPGTKRAKMSQDKFRPQFEKTSALDAMHTGGTMHTRGTGNRTLPSREAQSRKMRPHSREQVEAQSSTLGASSSQYASCFLTESNTIASQHRMPSPPLARSQGKQATTTKLPLRSASPPPAQTLQQRSPSPPAAQPSPPPALMQHRSPPPPPRVGRSVANESPPAVHRQLDFSVASSPDLAVKSPDPSPEVSFGRTRLSGTRGRSLSPMPAATLGESRVGISDAFHAPSNEQPPQNAWSTASQWNGWRSTSVPPVLNSTHRSDDNPPHMTQSSSVCSLPGIVSPTLGRDMKSTNSKNGLGPQDAGAPSGSDTLNSFDSSAEMTSGSLKPGTGTSSMSRGKSKIWR